MRDEHESLRVARPTPDETPAALELLFGGVSPEERAGRMALLHADSVEPPTGLWCAYHDSKVVSAILAQAQPGRSAMIWPPSAIPEAPLGAREALVEHALSELSTAGVQLAQVLLKTEQDPDAPLFREAGFRHAADVLYLLSVAGSFPASEPNSGLEFVAFTENYRPRLVDLVRRTYVGSLDCPAIDAARNIDDVLHGYRASGRHDPKYWLLARQGAADVGCILLTDHPDEQGWELLYLGIVPEVRGRGIGLALVRHAQWLAGCAARSRIVLAVDAANAPAVAMYEAAGFVEWDQRSVFFRVL